MFYQLYFSTYIFRFCCPNLLQLLRIVISGSAQVAFPSRVALHEDHQHCGVAIDSECLKVSNRLSYLRGCRGHCLKGSERSYE